MCMRTTLVIPDAVYRELKRRAAETGKTISGLATEFIRRGLSTEPRTGDLPPLPTASLGRPLVDVSDREALYRALEAERDRRLYGVEAEADEAGKRGEPSASGGERGAPNPGDTGGE